MKRHRQSLRRQERNRARRTAARTAVRQARELIVAGNEDEAQAAVRRAGAVLDRAAHKGVLHANNAARRKSRLAHQLKVAQAPAEEPPTGKGAPSKARASRTSRAKKT